MRILSIYWLPVRIHFHGQTGLADLRRAGSGGSASGCMPTGLGFKLQVELGFTPSVTY